MPNCMLIGRPVHELASCASTGSAQTGRARSITCKGQASLLAEPQDLVGEAPPLVKERMGRQVLRSLFFISLLPSFPAFLVFPSHSPSLSTPILVPLAPPTTGSSRQCPPPTVASSGSPAGIFDCCYRARLDSIPLVPFVFPNHPVVLGPRFEETAPRVLRSRRHLHCSCAMLRR